MFESEEQLVRCPWSLVFQDLQNFIYTSLYLCDLFFSYPTFCHGHIFWATIAYTTGCIFHWDFAMTLHD